MAKIAKCWYNHMKCWDFRYAFFYVDYAKHHFIYFQQQKCSCIYAKVSILLLCVNLNTSELY